MAATSPPSDPVAGSEWRRSVDKKSNRPYWWNTATRERRWDAPPSHEARTVRVDKLAESARATARAEAAHEKRVSSLRSEIRAYEDRQSAVAARVTLGDYEGLTLTRLWPDLTAALHEGGADNIAREGFAESTVALAAVAAELDAANATLSDEARAHARELVMLGQESALALAQQSAAHQRVLAELDASLLSEATDAAAASAPSPSSSPTSKVSAAKLTALANEIESLRAQQRSAASAQRTAISERSRLAATHRTQLATLRQTATTEQAEFESLSAAWSGELAAVEARGVDFAASLAGLRDSSVAVASGAEDVAVALNASEESETTSIGVAGDLRQAQHAQHQHFELRVASAQRAFALREEQLRLSATQATDALAQLQHDYATVVDGARRLYAQCEGHGAEKAELMRRVAELDRLHDNSSSSSSTSWARSLGLNLDTHVAANTEISRLAKELHACERKVAQTRTLERERAAKHEELIAEAKTAEAAQALEMVHLIDLHLSTEERLAAATHEHRDLLAAHASLHDDLAHAHHSISDIGDLAMESTTALELVNRVHTAQQSSAVTKSEEERKVIRDWMNSVMVERKELVSQIKILKDSLDAAEASGGDAKERLEKVKVKLQRAYATLAKLKEENARLVTQAAHTAPRRSRSRSVSPRNNAAAGTNAFSSRSQSPRSPSPFATHASSHFDQHIRKGGRPSSDLGLGGGGPRSRSGSGGGGSNSAVGLGFRQRSMARPGRPPLRVHVDMDFTERQAEARQQQQQQRSRNSWQHSSSPRTSRESTPHERIGGSPLGSSPRDSAANSPRRDSSRAKEAVRPMKFGAKAVPTANRAGPTTKSSAPGLTTELKSAPASRRAVVAQRGESASTSGRAGDARDVGAVARTRRRERDATMDEIAAKLIERFVQVAARRRKMLGDTTASRFDDDDANVRVDALGFLQAALGCDGVTRCPISIARLFASVASPARSSDGSKSRVHYVYRRSYRTLMLRVLSPFAAEREKAACAFAILSDAAVRRGAGWMHAQSSGAGVDQKWRKRWVHVRSLQRRTLSKGESGYGVEGGGDDDEGLTTLRLFKTRDPSTVELALLREKGPEESVFGRECQLTMRVSSSSRLDATTVEVTGFDEHSGARGELALRTQDDAQCTSLTQALEGGLTGGRGAIDRNALKQLLVVGLDELNNPAETLTLTEAEIDAILDKTFTEARAIGSEIGAQHRADGAITLPLFTAMCERHPLMTSHLRISLLPATKPLGASPRWRSGIRVT